METLHQFTLELDCHKDALQCSNCAACNAFVSHGFVYKKQHDGDKKPVGKRILCSNRYGKSGCGCTLRLYLAADIPTLQYACIHLFVFLSALITGLNIQQAYQKATGTLEPRNAYRWLVKLDLQLAAYRGMLNPKRGQCADSFFSRSKRFQLLLPTLLALFSLLGNMPCTHYQLIQQTTFM